MFHKTKLIDGNKTMKFLKKNLRLVLWLNKEYLHGGHYIHSSLYSFLLVRSECLYKLLGCLAFNFYSFLFKKIYIVFFNAVLK